MVNEGPIASSSKLGTPQPGDASYAELDPSESHIGHPGQFDEDEEILIKRMPSAKLTGLKHYAGHKKFQDGLKLFARREKTNATDKNAIVVLHTDERTKCGYIKKDLTARLAPLVDEGKISLVPYINKAPLSSVGLQETDIALEIRGKRSHARDPRLDWLFPARKKRKVQQQQRAQAATDRSSSPKALHSTNGATKMSAPEITTLVEELDGKPSGDVLSALFQASGWDPIALPLHPKPPGRQTKKMKTDLLPFQSQGLRWMISMEHPQLPKLPSDLPTQLWVLKKDTADKPYYYNLATRLISREQPKLRRGGILADEMGLGKTMQTIALISTDDTGKHVIDEPEDPDDRYDDMTLVVCPLSVASNWTTQLHTHVGSKRIKWHLYHGAGRELSRKQLREQFDVVIVPYNTLAAELAAAEAKSRESSKDFDDDEPAPKKAKKERSLSTLHGIKWRRVVLDEGHTIKNPNAKMSIACVNLIAERRWVLTGTPIVNSSSDLGAMMRFLKLCSPLDEKEAWLKYIEHPLKAGDEQAKTLLRAVVSSTTLRRTKDMRDPDGKPLVELPAIQFYLHRVQLSERTRTLYDTVEKSLSAVVRKMLEKGGRSYTQLMVVLLRLRQIACHPTLCPESFIDAVRADHVDALLREEEAGASGSLGKHEPDRGRLQHQLRQMTAEAGEGCAMCRNLPNEARITICGHIFCLGCIEDYVEEEHECPVCLHKLTLKELIGSPRGSEEPVIEETEVTGRQRLDGIDKLAPLEAAKTDELVRLLRATDPDVKSLVFSQWTTHLNLIQEALSKAGITTCRFDGSMSQYEREQVIKTFSMPLKPADQLRKGEQASPTVMLISLRAGALGLNLTAASQVFLMDPWWQASIEQQAIDRVYRIGQTKPVRVFQLVADKTVEARVLEIQQKKNQLIEQAFSGSKNGGRAGPEKIESRLDDLKSIFGSL